MGGGTTFSASPATVSVPTGSISIEKFGGFTVPSGVHVIEVTCDQVDTVYVGVTPNTTHHIAVFMDEDPYLEDFNWQVICDAHSNKVYIDNHGNNDSGIVDISWSPKINTHTPTVTDY